MMSKEELVELLKSELPHLLQTDEEFRTVFFGLMVQHLPSREEYKQILERLEHIEQEQVALREDFGAMQKIIEAILKRIESIETKQAILADTTQGIREELGEMRTAFGRFGILVESVLRNALQTAVENWFGAGRVERMILGGREVDVVIRDGQHVILEITARAHLQDIDKLKVSAEDYEQQFQIKPRLAIACAYITPQVVRRLIEEGIELISAEVPE